MPLLAPDAPASLARHIAACHCSCLAIPPPPASRPGRQSLQTQRLAHADCDTLLGRWQDDLASEELGIPQDDAEAILALVAERLASERDFIAGLKPPPPAAAAGGRPAAAGGAAAAALEAAGYVVPEELVSFAGRLADAAAVKILPYFRCGVAVSDKATGSGEPLGRRRDCHFTGIPSPSILKHVLKGEGFAAE